MSDEEIDKKAQIMTQSTKSIAETVADEFEKWLQNHQDSTRKQAHDRLVGAVKCAIVSSHLLMRAIMED